MKALETRWNGRRFRSRTEARWAVFFDELCVPYEYEREGFELPSGNYLPDFWLPEQDCWIEIKGTKPTEKERTFAGELSEFTQKTVYIFSGQPPTPKWVIDHAGNFGGEAYGPLGGADYNYLWCACNDSGCNRVGIEFDGRGDRICHGFGGKGYSYDNPRILAAYTAALSERFGT